jgi:GNAT superfamily N-acetyltransferase
MRRIVTIDLEMSAMNIQLAESDAEIAACFPVMRELRPHLDEASFVARVRSQQASGYLLACAADASGPVAVAGFRLGEGLSWGRYLYVDDLVTLQGRRSQGFGGALLAWLKDYAARHGCGQLHLDSGVQRKDAHRFYEREGMEAVALHFAARVQIKMTSEG